MIMIDFLYNTLDKIKYFFYTIKDLFKWNILLYKIYMFEPDEFMIIYKTDLAGFKYISEWLNEHYEFLNKNGLSTGDQESIKRDLKVLQNLLNEIINNDHSDKNVNTRNFHRFLNKDFGIEYLNNNNYLKKYLREQKVKHLYNKIRSEKLEHFWT